MTIIIKIMSDIKKYILFLALLATTALGSHATVLDSISADVRLGYALGGTLPTHLNNKIRHLNSYDPGFNFSVAAEASYPLNQRWSIHTGLRLELGSMDVDSRVKNYDIEVVRGDESLDGIFTGNVRIKSAQRRLTLPIQASYALNDKWQLRGGVFMGWLMNRRFWGWAYDGYLREGSPIGAKIEMGTEPGERGDFDFDANMRHMQWGIDVGADYQFYRHWGAFAEVTYGLSGLFKSDFSAVETLRPLYGTLGILYRFK